MGLRGPAPKPVALKVLEGRPVSKKKQKQEARFRTEAPPCPEWLDDQAKQEWARLSPDLEKMGLLTAADLAAFACYCRAYSELKAAVAVLEKEGRTFVSGKGYILPRPEVAMMNRAMKAIREFSVQFGFTPSSRNRIEVVPEDNNEDLD